MKPNIEIYIHIPFCEKKCNYCDFLSFRSDVRTQAEYMTQLKQELAAMSTELAAYTVSSCFVGGGTPSLLPPHMISELLDSLRRYCDVASDAEITIESNPGSLMRHKLSEYREAGINRLSIGLQSADNAELKLLGRIHTFEDFLKTYQTARMEGFNNINIDLIDCIPMQSMNTWRKTLRNVVMLKPEHISVYNLIIEPGTVFHEMDKEGVLLMPSEEEQTQIDEYTRTYMKKMGYVRYEFSNWAKSGRECKHNLGYWQGVPYIGLGLGASSYFNGCRWKNTDDIREYMQLDLKDKGIEALRESRKEYKELSRDERMEEFMILGLRCVSGVSESVFYGRFGRELGEVYGTQLSKYVGMGLIEHVDGMYRLTERGIDVSNVILSEFL